MRFVGERGGGKRKGILARDACQEQGVMRGRGQEGGGGETEKKERVEERLTVAATSKNSLRAFMRFPPPSTMSQYQQAFDWLR